MRKFVLLLSIALVACNSAEKQTSATPEPVAAIEEAEPVGAVARYTFAAAIVDREPVWASAARSTDSGEEAIYFFTELMNLSGQTAHHLWKKNGEEIYDYTSNVTENRWRTYSRMKLTNFKPGDVLQVSVTDGEGNVLAQSSIVMPQPVIDPKYLITSKGAGIFLTDARIPTELAGYDITKVTEIDDGDEYDIYIVSENGQQLLSIENGYGLNTTPMIADNINILSDKLKTSKNIGVGSTIDEFITAYPDAQLYFWCLSSSYTAACEDPEYFAATDQLSFIYFYFDEKGFNMENFDQPEYTSEALVLEPSDFKEDTKIKKIIIFPDWSPS
ncbi:MAG: DUF2914 domain-containing protein [Deferribacteraceae bacterium]|jgi:hypothetical protein|nr:DUF2914 domain-containing protein [Deferribacteraceae bacterium]